MKNKKRNLTKEELIKVQEMPKAILHLHMDGALKPETVFKRLKENPLNKEEIEEWFEKGYIFETDKNLLLEIAKIGKNITLEEVREKLSVKVDCRSLNEYLEKFSLPGAVLQTEEQIEESTYEVFQNLANQNVIYAEVRFAPSKHIFRGLTQEKVVEAAINGMNRAKKEFGIEGNLILCCMRGDKEENNFKTVDVAKKYLGKGVCALDLAGAEALFKAKDHKNIFDKAKKLNIPFTLHAGEADGAQSIKDALKLGASRIGHGVRCLEDEKLVRYLIEHEIPLEVCPISNLQTKATIEPHPIEELVKKGLKVTVNTDNDTVSNTSIIKEYIYILENTNLTIEDLKNMNINAIRGAFIKVQDKAKLIAKLNNYGKEKKKIKE